ncbi:MAG: hypothetical protein JWP01_2055 [Myxococcales bacterium]|nr:hypothetical protein [Myxococcales bacterium]
MRNALGAVVLFAIGCGNDGGMNTGVDAAPVVDAPGATDPDAAAPPADFTKLIGRTWTLAGGQLDTYVCMRATVAADTYITNIVAQAPSGTHHTVLSIATGNVAGPDGEYDCDVGELGTQMLYASGVGTSPLDFPTGVGVKIAAGTQIHLNLHLFNATDGTLTGDSGIFVKAQATPPATLAEMAFAGKFDVRIPPTNMPANVGPAMSGCDAPNDFKLFAVWPHMHKLATHQKMTITRNGTTTVIHDQDFHFEEQTYYKQTPEFQVLTGDQIRVTCTYINNTGAMVGFGDSSNNEMCFTGMYRYPAAVPATGLFDCTDTRGFGF